MPQRRIDIIMPAYNEANGIERSLNAIAQEIRYVADDHHVNLIVLPNGCADETAGVAENWGETRPDKLRDFDFSIVEVEESGKNHAINEGVYHSEHDLLFIVDSDISLDNFALAGLVNVLKADRPVAASLYHAADPNYLPAGELGILVRMADFRRQAIPIRHKLHGAFMGWNSQATLQGHTPVFPETAPVSDDTWLSYALIAEHGLDVIHSVNNGTYSRYVPPQNETDYIDQHSRYALSEELANQSFPPLAGAIKLAQAQIPDPAVVEVGWRRLCYENGIDFDAYIACYSKMRAAIEQNRPAMKQALLALNGTWKAVTTARL